MQSKEKARRVQRGNFGELWLGSRKLAELTGYKAEVGKSYASVELCGDLWEHKRLQSVEGTGTIDLLRVDSFTDPEEIQAIVSGVDPVYTIISKVNDPDTAGAERWAYYNVALENITLADFTAKQFSKRNVKFHFAGCEALDTVDPE